MTIAKFRDILPWASCHEKSRWRKKEKEKEKLWFWKTDISPHPGSESEGSLLQSNFYCIKYQPAALRFVIRFRKRPLRARWGTFEVSARQLYCHRNTSISWEGVLPGAEKNWAVLQRHPVRVYKTCASISMRSLTCRARRSYKSCLSTEALQIPRRKQKPQKKQYNARLAESAVEPCKYVGLMRVKVGRICVGMRVCVVMSILAVRATPVNLRPRSLARQDSAFLYNTHRWLCSNKAQ